jgi:hypothetical protein
MLPIGKMVRMYVCTCNSSISVCIMQRWTWALHLSQRRCPACHLPCRHAGFGRTHVFCVYMHLRPTFLAANTHSGDEGCGLFVRYGSQRYVAGKCLQIVDFRLGSKCTRRCGRYFWRALTSSSHRRIPS